MRTDDVVALLEAAALLAPEGAATGPTGPALTADDVWEYLVRDQWELAVEVLEDLAATGPLPGEFWDGLAEAAARVRMDRSEAWCRWRSAETRAGVLRAELTLGDRPMPLPGAGVLRPMWDTGAHQPAVAALWVEHRPELDPGGRATVRLAPLAPERWRHVRPGQVIGMYEHPARIAGTAVVLEVSAPVAR